MRIGIDIRVIGKKRTGDEAVFFNLVKSLAEIDSQNEYVLFTDNRDEKDLTEIGRQLGIAEKENFKIVSLKTKNKFDWNFFTLPNYLKSNPVDVYETQYITPFFVSKKIKIVTIIHDISFNFFPKMIRFADLFFLKLLIPVSLKRADAIVAVSEFTKNEIVRYYKIYPEKVFVVHNALAESFLYSTADRNDLAMAAKKYDLPPRFISYLGTLQPRKNIPQLIEAFAKIKDKIEGIKLVIGGNRNAHNADAVIDRKIQEFHLENDVFFTGYIDEADKKAFYQLSEAFVFPSLYEGFGIPILEAMSQETPVLASDIESLKEIGKNGALYFDYTSIDDFSEKLYSIITNSILREKLIQSGQVRASYFSWKDSASKNIEMFEKILYS